MIEAEVYVNKIGRFLYKGRFPLVRSSLPAFLDERFQTLPFGRGKKLGITALISGEIL